MDWTLFALFLLACGASATTGAMFEPGAWYRALRKPPWTPPNWVFPAAWSVLYICIALAASRVAGLPGSGIAMALFAAQLAYNVLWTPVFFGLRNMRAAMMIIAVLWLTVAGTLVAFWQLDTLAGALFVPYLIWVTIAGALNLSVLRLNPAAQAA